MLATVSKMLTVQAVCIVSLCGAPDSQKAPHEKRQKRITIHTIKCVVPETLSGPDKVYILINDDQKRVNFDSLEAFKGAKALKADDVWTLDKSIVVDAEATVAIQVMDRDSSVECAKPILEALAEGAKAAADAASDSRAAASAKVVAAISEALAKADDPDDQLLFCTLASTERGTRLKQSETKGTSFTGSSSRYEIEYSIEEDVKR